MGELRAGDRAEVTAGQYSRQQDVLREPDAQPSVELGRRWRVQLVSGPHVGAVVHCFEARLRKPPGAR